MTRWQFDDGTVLDGTTVTGGTLLAKRLRVELAAVLGVAGQRPTVAIGPEPSEHVLVEPDDPETMDALVVDLARMCGARLVSGPFPQPEPKPLTALEELPALTTTTY